MGIENDIKSDCGCLADITDALFENGIEVHTMRDINHQKTGIHYTLKYGS